LMASLVDVLVVQQWAFVTLLLLVVLLVLGWSVVKQILFPLLYLYFMVPFGEQFITPMMYMTADVVITAIELTGIPIHSEGTFFTLPSGSWSVVEGCSGVRYLIASIALGTLYAYMTYSSYLKRSVFIIASILTPIVANWIRAFIIVMLGHFSGMKLATGVDHIIYGWFFFGLVLFIMFWVGSYWREDEEARPIAEITNLIQEKMGRFSLILLSGLLLISIGPVMDYRIKQNSLQNADQFAEIKLFENSNWQKSELKPFQWTPQYINPSAHYQTEYKPSGTTGVDTEVGLYLAYYAVQQQDSELINSQNIMIPQKHPVWSQLREEKQTISIQNQTEIVLETHLTSNQSDLLIWHWNVIAGKVIINSYEAKLIEAFNKLSGNTQGEYAVAVYTQLDKKDLQTSRKKLQQFVNNMDPVIRNSFNEHLLKTN
ncbi:MAG: EpsI family protein, partial [Thiotrichaceae bacterium]|nr:EpsI family protein [Thiotrichaceae bacterium]